MDPVTAGLVISGVSGVASAYQGVQAGYQQEAAMLAQAEGAKEQAYAKKLEATEQGNLRRERLLTAMASQNVRGGAAGVQGGTVEALQLKSMEDYRRDQMQADAQTGLVMSGLERQRQAFKLQGKQMRKQAIFSSAKTLLDTGVSFGGAMGGGGSPAVGSPEYWTQANSGQLNVRS